MSGHAQPVVGPGPSGLPAAIPEPSAPPNAQIWIFSSILAIFVHMFLIRQFWAKLALGPCIGKLRPWNRLGMVPRLEDDAVTAVSTLYYIVVHCTRS